MDGGKKKIIKKILNIFINVILYFFLAICLFSLIVGIASKKDQAGATEIFGIKMYIVLSPSMEKCADTPVDDYKIKSIPVYSMVFVDPVPDEEEDGKDAVDGWYAALKVGDVLTFRTDDYGGQLTITHRITDIRKLDNGGYRIELRGDNTGVNGDGTEKKEGDSKPMTQVIEDTSAAGYSADYVLGKVTGHSLVLGWLAYSMQRPVGIVLVIIIPCAIIILLQAGRIISVLGEDKKKKAQEKERKTEEELEELKRQLAELQQGKAPPPDKSDEEQGQ